MKIGVYVATAKVGSIVTGTIELDDEATEEDIEDAVKEWVRDHVNYGWTINKDTASENPHHTRAEGVGVRVSRPTRLRNSKRDR